MSTFKEFRKTRDRIAKRVLVLTPDMFIDTCENRPNEEVAIGLRKIADGDVQIARAEAAKYAIEMHNDREGQIEAFNDCLMRWMIISGTCDPNDIAHSTSLFEGSEENVKMMLTPQTIRFLWDHIDAFQVESSPLVPAIDDEDIDRVASRLLMGPLPEAMPQADQIRIRKFLGMILRDLETYEPSQSADDAVEDIPA